MTLLRLAAGCLTALCLTACGGAPASAPASAPSQDAAPSGTVTLPTGYPERPFARVEFDKPPFAPPALPLPPPAPAETATRVKPVVSAGLKAYISPRAFFRADILISPWTTSRDVTVRGGIGVDLK